MFGSVRLSIIIAGICVLGFALFFGENVLPLTSLFSTSAPFIYINKDLTAPSKPPTLAEAQDQENKQEEKTETAPEQKEVLGTSPEKLKTVQEERALVEEPPAPAPTPPPAPSRLSSRTLYEIAAERIVNLFCELPNNEVAIATGVIIHSNGYILTNAHVADTEQSRTCLIRRGSPARNFAIAERVFLPPGFTSESHTRENLARDVAIWKITDVIEKNDASIFPSLSIRPAQLPADGAALATFSYPAELLGSQAVVSALYLSFSETHVVSHDAYFIESAEGLGSQKGSSGGILIDPFTGEFAGLIFAISDAKTEYVSERTLFSLTPFAINETIRAATGKDLDAYLDTNP